MTNVNVGYGRFSYLIAFFEKNSHITIIHVLSTLKLHKTFTNFVLRKKYSDEKQPYAIIYGYVSLVF